MLNYLEHKQISHEKWDACVEGANQDLPYAYSWFLDIVCENWSGLILNDYEAVMPLPWKKKLGLRMIYQPFFTQQLGVFGQHETTQFIKALPQHYRYIHTNFNYLNKISTSKENFAEQVNLVLEIKENAADFFSVNCRRNVKKAEKENLHLKKCEASALISIFSDTRGKRIQHLKQKNYDTLLKVINAFHQRNMCDITGIYDADQNLLGGAVLVHYRNRSIFFFSALTENGKDKAAMYFLISAFLKKSVGRVLDFEGSNNEGLQRFYKGFGAHEQNYFSFVQNHLPAPLRLLKK